MTRSGGAETSLRKEGARVRRAYGSEDGGVLTFVADSPRGTVAVYQLSMDAAGTGSLLMTSIRNRAVGVTKGSLMQAECSRPK